MKSYENGIPIDGDTRFIAETVWGRVSRQNSLTYAFENSENARPMQDVGLDGLPNADEFTFPAYSEYLDKLRIKLSELPFRKCRTIRSLRSMTPLETTTISSVLLL